MRIDHADHCDYDNQYKTGIPHIFKIKLIYFGGSDDAPAAYVEVNVFGRSVPGSAWEKLTKSIMAALNSELGIPEDRTYIRYTATTDWGWNGGNF